MYVLTKIRNDKESLYLKIKVNENIDQVNKKKKWKNEKNIGGKRDSTIIMNYIHKKKNDNTNILRYYLCF